MSYMPDSQCYPVNLYLRNNLGESFIKSFKSLSVHVVLEHVVHTISGIVNGSSTARTIKTGVHVRNFLGVQFEAEYIEIQVIVKYLGTDVFKVNVEYSNAVGVSVKGGVRK